MADQSAFEQLVIDVLNQHTEAFREVKNELVAVGAVAEQTLTQATRTNGRVDKLEDKVLRLEAQAHDAEVARRARLAMLRSVATAAGGVKAWGPWILAMTVAATGGLAMWWWG